MSIACSTMRLPAAKSETLVGVGDRLAALRLDLVDHLLGRPLRAAFAGVRDAEVVDDDRSTFSREEQRVLAAEAAAGAGHDDDASVTDTHRSSLRCGLVEWGRAYRTFAQPAVALRRVQSRSMIVTFAWPPPSHIVCRP